MNIANCFCPPLSCVAPAAHAQFGSASSTTRPNLPMPSSRIEFQGLQQIYTTA